jgi:hypothetical protein
MATAAVVGAAVPEAAIDEDGDAASDKDEVGSPVQVSERTEIDAVPGTACVQRSSETQLGFCTDAPHCLHPPSNRF